MVTLPYMEGGDMQVVAPEVQPVLPGADALLRQDDGTDIYRQQMESLKQHEEYAQMLQQKQDEARKRQEDLNISEKMLRILDTTLPKGLRDFEMRGLSRQLGLDPKGDTAKDITKLVTSLDPDSAQAVKETFVAQIGDASPGQIAGFARDILQGKIDPGQLAGMVKTGRQVTATPGKGIASDQGTETAELGAGRFSAAGVAASTGTMGTPDPASTPAAGIPPRGQAAPADNRSVDPAVAAALGYDPNTSSSAEILQRHPSLGNWDSMTQEQKAKTLDDLQKSRQNTIEAKTLADKIIKNVEADPASVPISTAIVPIAGSLWQKYATSKEEFNLSAWITSIGDTVNSHLKKLGIEPGDQSERGKKIRETALRYAEISNDLVALAYASAKQKDPSGRLSDQDIAIEMRSLSSATGSADMFKTAIKNYADNTVNRYNLHTRTKTGSEGAPIDTPGLQTLNTGRIAGPTGSEPAAGTGRAPPLGAAAPLEGAVPTGPPREVKLTPSTPSEQAQDVRSKAVQKEEAEAQKRTEESQIRQYNIQQAPIDARLKMEAAQRDVERLEMAKEAAKEARDWKEYQKLKDAQAQAQKQADKISAAFAQFARALARTGGGISLGSAPQGAEQDASAFRLSERPQRKPPTPAPAVSGQTYRARRRQREE